MSEDEEQQSMELETLKAIYDTLFTENCDGNPGSHAVLLSTSSGSECLRVVFHVPKNYPSEGTPIFEIDDFSRSLSADHCEQIETLLHQAAREKPREPILFDWIEILRSFVADHEKELEGHSPLGDSETVGKSAQLALGDEEEDEEAWDYPEEQNYEAEIQRTHSKGGEGDDKRNQRKTEGSSSSREGVICPSILHGDPFEDRKSVFQAHLAKVKSMGEVSAVLDELLSDRKVARATHNISAYRFIDQNGRLVQDNDDDGETAAGGRLGHLLEILDVKDVFVVVSRWYGGIQLGPDRFKHINNVARGILEKAGHILGQEAAGKPSGGGGNKAKTKKT